LTAKGFLFAAPAAPPGIAFDFCRFFWYIIYCRI